MVTLHHAIMYKYCFTKSKTHVTNPRVHTNNRTFYNLFFLNQQDITKQSRRYQSYTNPLINQRLITTSLFCYHFVYKRKK